MQFEYNDKCLELLDQLKAFMAEHIYPIEQEIYEFVHDPKNLWVPPPQIEALKEKATAAGLWNLFLPVEYEPYSPGLTNLEYAPLAEEMATWKYWRATRAMRRKTNGWRPCWRARYALHF